MSRLATPLLERVRSAFQWVGSAQRYRSTANGRFVTQTAVKRAVNRVIAGAKSEIAALARQVADGSIEISAWQVRMASELKSLHLASVAAARGGFPNLSAADYGRAGQVLRQQYGYLNQFAVDIETGRALPGRIESRSALYISAANATYEASRRDGAEIAGLTLERNILGDGEHCPECIAEAMRGWVGIGELSLPGTRLCKMNCLCRLEHKRP